MYQQTLGGMFKPRGVRFFRLFLPVAERKVSNMFYMYVGAAGMLLHISGKFTKI